MENKTVGRAEYYKEKYDIQEYFNHVFLVKAPIDIPESALPLPLRDEDTIHGYIVNIKLDGRQYVILVDDYLREKILETIWSSFDIEIEGEYKNGN